MLFHLLRRIEPWEQKWYCFEIRPTCTRFFGRRAMQTRGSLPSRLGLARAYPAHQSLIVGPSINLIGVEIQ